MKLREYIKEVRKIPIAAFAREAKVCTATIENILNGKTDIRLSIALRIEALTNNSVTCRELLPEQLLKDLEARNPSPYKPPHSKA